MNYHCPEILYFAALNKALSTITPVILDKQLNETECLNEFVGHWYWACENKNEKLLVISNLTDSIQPLNIVYPIKNSKNSLDRSMIAYTEDFSGFSEYSNIVISCKNVGRIKKSKGVVIKISKLILPPAPGEAIKDWWKKQLLSLEAKQQELFNNSLSNIKYSEYWIVLNSNYGRKSIWFALKCNTFNKKQKSKPPVSTKHLPDWIIKAVQVNMISRDILLPRAGLNKIISNKKVSVIGCGAIGSLIAQQIASSGVKILKLYDIDCFEAVNLYRHILDLSCLNTAKTHSIAKLLESKYPFTRFESYTTNIINIPIADIKDNDIIIVAIGNPTYELLFNEQLVGNNINIPTIYCWTEPYGLGGHIVYNSGNYTEGCLACNYFDPNTDTPTLNSNMNFLEPNQNIVEDIGSCGSLYLPYTHLDANQTALLVSRLTIECLTEKLIHSKRVSWKSNDIPAEIKELKFTHRYLKLNGTIKEENNFKEENCPVCKKYHC